MRDQRTEVTVANSDAIRALIVKFKDERNRLVIGSDMRLMSLTSAEMDELIEALEFAV